MASSGEPNGQPDNESASHSDSLLLWASGGVGRLGEVPERFRKGSEEFYRPRVVSIGPFHDTNLRCGGIKLQYGQAFVDRYGWSNDYLHDVESRLGERGRDNYWGSLKQSPEDFGRMMLVDGAFLLELMLRSRFPEYRKAGDDDPIFNSRRIIVDVCRDILLIENQLPLFVLEELYQEWVVPHPRPDKKDVSLAQLASEFFNAHLPGNKNIIGEGITPTPTGHDETQFDKHSKAHLVAFVRSFYSPRQKSNPSSSSSAADGDNYRRPNNNDNDVNITVKLIPPSVTTLYEAGVKFEKVTSTSSGLNIEFGRGSLKIPCLDYRTGTLFLNMMVFEEDEYFLLTSGRNYISQFMFFMGWMIRTSKDVDILIDSGIISTTLGSNTDLVALFDRISKMGWPHDYFRLCKRLDDHCKSSPWHKWKATLKRDYFDTPWKIASTIAAVILLVLTFVQTVCSFLSLKH